MPLLEAFIFFSFWAFGIGQLKMEQPKISISRTRDKTAHIPCKVFSSNFNNEYIHWYRQKSDQNIEHLTFVYSTTSPVQQQIGGKNKLEARKDPTTSISTLKIIDLEKEDEATYYCAGSYSSGWIKIFGEGTKLIVIPPDKNLDGEFMPKPTVFLPSIAEISHHKAGTYLCLLENFYPDVIKVDWKEKNGNTVLDSQLGNSILTENTYMKFSWLTVPETSLTKDHICVIKHEFNKGGFDQEILFPSIKKDADNSPTNFNQEDKSDPLQLQFTHTSAYYTYVLLLLKSTMYFAIITFILFQRIGICANGKSP